jgi:hypothetical protein
MKLFKVFCFNLFSLFLFTFTLFAQAPDTLWTRTYGGGSSDEGESIHQTIDGGYIIAGYTESFGAGLADIYLIKADSSGNTMWTKTYGGTGDEYATAVLQTSDNGFIVTGWTYSFGATECDAYLIKTNSNGDTIWIKIYGGPEYDKARSFQKTSDNGYIITGVSGPWSTGDAYLIKVDSIGTTLWTKTFGGSGLDDGWSVQQTSDSGYIITGCTDSFGSGDFDIYLIKTDPSGDTLWTKVYGRTNYDDRGMSVKQTPDGGYIVAGFTETQTGYTDIYLVKTDENGDSLWTKVFGAQYYDFCNSMIQTIEGEFVITGMSESSSAPLGDFYLAKIDLNGNVLWERTYGGPDTEEAFSVQITSDGGYIMVGYTESFGAGSYDIWLIKTEPDVGVEEKKDLRHETRGLRVTAHPNPFTDKLEINLGMYDVGCKMYDTPLKIYDTSGRLVKSVHLQTNNILLGSELSPGVYFMKANGKSVGKVVKVR